MGATRVQISELHRETEGPRDRGTQRHRDTETRRHGDTETQRDREVYTTFHQSRYGCWRIAISRDGSTIVAGGADDLLYVRRSDDTEFRPIPGSEGGRNPSISPGGGWVVFSQGSVNSRDSRLVKTQLAGGPILPVSTSGGNPHWFSRDEIVYTVGGDVYRVSAAGGEGTLIVEAVGGRGSEW